MAASKKKRAKAAVAKAKPRAGAGSAKARPKAKKAVKPKPAAKAKPPVKAKPAAKARSVAKAKDKPKTVAKAKAPSPAKAAAKPAAKAKTPSVRPAKPSKETAKDGFGNERPTLMSATFDGKAKPKKEEITSAGGITSDAVMRRTGKNWDDWFAILDGAGARELDHKGIVAILAQRHGVGPWWQQMVTVAYEQIRGKREKHETETGFQASATKTIDVPLARLFRMWNDTDQRASWLSDERFQIKKASSGKSIRARWGRGTSHVDVYFQDKGTDKSAVSVQHNQIENRDAAEQMKAYWHKKLEALEKALT